MKTQTTKKDSTLRTIKQKVGDNITVQEYINKEGDYKNLSLDFHETTNLRVSMIELGGNGIRENRRCLTFTAKMIDDDGAIVNGEFNVYINAEDIPQCLSKIKKGENK